MCALLLPQVERDLEVVDDLGVSLVLAANTHAHADHITGSGKLKVGVHGSCVARKRIT